MKEFLAVSIVIGMYYVPVWNSFRTCLKFSHLTQSSVCLIWTSGFLVQSPGILIKIWSQEL
jgi:hypothetical protein